MMLGGFCGSARPEIAIAAPAAAVLRNVRRFPPTALKNERRFPLLLNTTSASHCSILISVEKLIIIIGENLAKAARFPHSHSSGDEAVGKWKTKNRFPTFPPPFR